MFKKCLFSCVESVELSGNFFTLYSIATYTNMVAIAIVYSNVGLFKYYTYTQLSQHMKLIVQTNIRI